MRVSDLPMPDVTNCDWEDDEVTQVIPVETMADVVSPDDDTAVEVRTTRPPRGDESTIRGATAPSARVSAEDFACLCRGAAVRVLEWDDAQGRYTGRSLDAVVR